MTFDSSPAGTSATTTTDSVAALAVLGDESRRRLFDFVRRARRPVTREEASAAVGISRKLAAFHLDKLVDAGLLQARHGGHGPRRVGRAPKVYEPSTQTLEITLPPRRHELLASLLTEAVTAVRPGESAHEAALRIARERGASLGTEARGGDVAAFLESLGFEPADDGGGRTVLYNCPFHPVAAQAPELVCGMNHAFLSGYLTASGHRRTTAVLEPHAGVCCVELVDEATDPGDGSAVPACSRDAGDHA
ncbi:helix-turn-helix transcriptional regulator [Streptomyces sp. NPDC014006]|uniref:helix-turn-helix transcriptional regulator n=1 Tax=Streptomyces sp. NPDC014006 TaxID=3364870 RepID=UPI00370245D7